MRKAYKDTWVEGKFPRREAVRAAQKEPGENTDEVLQSHWGFQVKDTAEGDTAEGATGRTASAGSLTPGPARS